MVGEPVGWRGVAGALLGLLGIVVLIDPLRFDWSDRAVAEGHAWLLLGGLQLGAGRPARASASLAPAAARRACPGKMLDGDHPALDSRSRLRAPRLFWISASPNLWIALFYIGLFAGPDTGPWAAVSVARALPPVTGSLGMLGTPLPRHSPRRSSCWAKSVTWPLVLGTMLVIAGIAIVIVERAK